MSELDSPLNILTLDGIDFQGQTSLLILSKLMETIAKLQGGDKPATRHLRPCDVFDVIGGAGIGGWLAMLLGPFQISVRECMNEYIAITQAIIRPDKIEQKMKQIMGGPEYDIEKLQIHVNWLAKDYNIGQFCWQEKTSPVRCQKCFVVARYRDLALPNRQYCLFRTYRADGVGDPDILYPDPENTLLSAAFAGTAAMKGCLYPFKLPTHSGSFGSDTFHGCFTNATTPALDQISRLSAHQNCRVSALINIAPPVPSPADLYKIKHQGSWASVSSRSSQSSNSSNGTKSSGEMPVSKNRGFLRRKLNNGRDVNDSENTLQASTHSGTDGGRGRVSVDAKNELRERRGSSKWREFPFVRRAFRKQKYAQIQRDLQEARDQHVSETRTRLEQMDPNALYVPLAPTNSPDKTALNDASALPEAQANIDEYLTTQKVQEDLETAAEHILKSYGKNKSFTANSKL